jgi:hypothetical protein
VPTRFMTDPHQMRAMAGRFDVHAQTVEDEARRMWASSLNNAHGQRCRPLAATWPAPTARSAPAGPDGIAMDPQTFHGHGHARDEQIKYTGLIDERLSRKVSSMKYTRKLAAIGSTVFSSGGSK